LVAAAAGFGCVVNAAITGATGFFGQFLVRRLVPLGGTVRAMYRRPADDERLRAWGATPVRGELDTPAGCADLVQPGDVVYHAAARVDLTGSWQQFVAITVEGTRRLLAAALPRRPARFVYVSSAGVYVRPRTVAAACADTTPAQPSSYNYYGRAKLAAEDLVREECTRAGCPWAILRLGFLYGPENKALFRRIAPLLSSGRLFIIGRGTNRIATLHVEDAVEAAVAVGTDARAAGRIYDVANSEPVTQREFLDHTADALGLPRPRVCLPYAVAFAGAALDEGWARLTHAQGRYTRAMVALMGVDQCVDSGPLERELGWRPRVQFLDGMQRMLEYHRVHPPL
jgi:nucleoside-diphosphate-sugar epimerase